MSNRIPSMPRPHSQSEADTETSSLVSSASLSDESSASEGGSEKSAQMPVMKTRQTGAKPTANSDTGNTNCSAPLQTAMTSSSPTLTNRPTVEERRAWYRQARHLNATQPDTNVKKTKTVKQGGEADLPQVPKPDSRWDRFTKALTANGKLFARDYDKSDIRELEAWLNTSPASLRELVIVSGSFGASGTVALAEALRGNATVSKLTLIDSGIGEQGAVALAETLRGNTTLTTLNLSSNAIGPQGAAALAEAFRGNTTLTTLNLGGNSIHQEGAAALAEAFRDNSTLTTLVLSYSWFGNDGAAALAEVIQGNTSLTTLDLGNNDIGVTGAAVLAEALQGNTSLTTLDLSRNQIGAIGAAALAEALRGNSTLTTLKLFHSGIDSEGAAALAEALQGNTTLTTLGLSRNHIGAAGAAALAEALRTNTTLTTLDLDSSSLGENGPAALIAALEINTTLTCLDVSYGVDPRFVQQIENLLSRNRRGKLLPYAEASLDLLVRHSPTLKGMDGLADVLPQLADQLPNEALAIFGQEWQDAFRAPPPPITTTTTNTTTTTTTTTTTGSSIPTTLITSASALATGTSSAPLVSAQPTATATDINALLADRNPVMALSRWIDGHENPTAALNWVDPTNGYTLLHYAVEAQQGAVVRSLLSRGIDSRKADHNNQTAAQLAQRRADSSSSQAVAAIAALFK